MSDQDDTLSLDVLNDLIRRMNDKAKKVRPFAYLQFYPAGSLDDYLAGWRRLGAKLEETPAGWLVHTTEGRILLMESQRIPDP